MTPGIDFLPPSYHQRRRGRQKWLWRRAIAVVFLVIAALGMLGQRQTRSRLEQTRDCLREQAAAAVAALESPTLLQQRIGELDTRADLLARLQVQTRPTRLLADTVNPLPPFVSLTELRVAREKLPAPAANPNPTARGRTAAPTARSPEQADLERLRKADAEYATFVSLNGIAPDDLAIAQYLAALHETGSFREVQLVYADQHEHRGHALRRFAVRLRVRRPFEQSPPRANL